MILKIFLLLSILVLKAKSQENAANSVAPTLVECYNNSDFLDRERRLPSSMNVLIALIRKIEETPYVQNDRELSMQLIQRFKQDGIVSFGEGGDSQYRLPVSPSGWKAHKNKIILRKVIPGIAANFPNASLSQIERCSLHFMLSNTIHLKPRGDEQQVCKKLGRFQRRIRRGLSHDMETFNPKSKLPSKNKLKETREPVDKKETDIEGRTDLSKKSINIEISECPVEDGVVYTRWGAVQAGYVIGGIAAARNLQTIPVSDIKVDGRYAATLAGDLSEVALYQGTRGIEEVEVGAKGGWQSTQVPRWYYIEKTGNLELTDAEIRGGLDGLIIAKNIDSWKDKTQSLKISQVLDMFYSQRGVFSSKYRACNRKEMYYEVAPKDELIKQTTGFTYLLKDEATALGSLYGDGYKTFSDKSVNALNDYISTIQDLNCVVDNDIVIPAAADVLIVTDTQWEFTLIESVIGYLLDTINVNPYGSNYTIINAKNGEVMVNSSNSILDFYLIYNKTVHMNAPTGFDAQTAFNTVQQLFESKMNNETNDKYSRGKSAIVLLLPYTIKEEDKSVAISKKDYFREYLPDVKILAIGRSGRQAFGDLVFDPSHDTFDLSDTSIDGTSIVQSINPLATRISEIHRRITNPKCGSGLSGKVSSDTFDQYIEPNSVSYYKISPQYFFGEGERSVKFQGYGYGNLVICWSRQQGKPKQNSTGDDTKCETMTGTNAITIKLTDACTDYDSISLCPPFYFSVQSNVGNTESRTIRCIDSGCRFPDNIKFTVQGDQLTCANGGSIRALANFSLTAIAILTLKIISSW